MGENELKQPFRISQSSSIFLKICKFNCFSINEIILFDQQPSEVNVHLITEI